MSPVTGIDAETIGTAPESWRVDPFRITDFRRTPEQMESLACFVPAVAGKKATMISDRVFRFLAECGHGGSPFARIRAMVADGTLGDNLRRVRIGKYALLTKCYTAMASHPSLNLGTVTPDELESFDGFGMKSSRFLILHSRENARVGVIDTHILKYLRAIGTERIPSTIPTGRDYLRLEAIILSEADRAGLPMADFDLRVWSWYASGKQGIPQLGHAEESAGSHAGGDAA